MLVGAVSYDSITFILSLYGVEDFASAEATKGLCDRPLEAFAAASFDGGGTCIVFEFGIGTVFDTDSFFHHIGVDCNKISSLRRRPKGFAIALWKPSQPFP